MLSIPLFEKLEFLGRNLRGIDAPFGDIQLLLFGDFHQLPPVPDEGETCAPFCFESPLWDVVIPINAKLSKNFRQSDPHYLALLREVRGGEIGPFTQNMLDRLERQIPTNEETLHLFTKRDAVLKKNTDILMDIDKEGVTFNAIDTGRMEYLKGCRFPKVLHLKEGSRVMLLENMPNLGLVNGERGKVITFIGKYPLVEFEEGEKVLIKERTFHQVRIWCKVFEGYKVKRAYTAVLEKKKRKKHSKLVQFSHGLWILCS